MIVLRKLFSDGNKDKRAGNVAHDVVLVGGSSAAAGVLGHRLSKSSRNASRLVIDLGVKRKRVNDKSTGKKVIELVEDPNSFRYKLSDKLTAPAIKLEKFAKTKSGKASMIAVPAISAGLLAAHRIHKNKKSKN